VIVDDDENFCELLSSFLRKIGVLKTSVANTLEAGKALSDTLKPDMLLLDIDLGSTTNGIELGTYVRKTLPHSHIIFFTNNYRQESFEAARKVYPHAFLDKELDEIKVRQAVELALMTGKSETLKLLENHLGGYLSNELSNESIFVKIGASFKKILFDEIKYVVYEDRYANLIIGDKKIPLNMTMKDLAKSLPTNKFIQVHQSYIVNIGKITNINLVYNQIEIDNKVLPMGASFKKQLQEKLLFLT
jgi:DNA-binding LytR/AlgR family response regulator